MASSPAERAALFTGSFPRSTAEVAGWHAGRAPEPILDPGQPIFDPHHHLYGALGDRTYYTIADLERDLGSGHRIVGTAYIEAYGAGWRQDGPEELRTVGEVDTILARTRSMIALPTGPCQVAAGIVAFADLMLGERVAPVLDALEHAAEGRLCGIRYRTAVIDGPVGRTIVNPPLPHLFLDLAFQRGVALLGERGLAFDAWVYDEQLPEMMALADACPDVGFVLDHLGGPVGVATTQSDIDERRRRWEWDMKALADRPNVTVKIGGMGMAMFGFGFEFGEKPADSVTLAAAWKDLFHICLDAFGPERCMFESNFPVDLQAASYSTIWNAFKRLAADLSNTERRALFYGTATRAYRLAALAAQCDAMR